ncbi:hypothetical protein [Methanococcoides seepicolus]|uniref:hypothetical protein n=1 Tax=Methanococcoides seepicolus TaxID=2828780 RepID=UPI002032E85C|nr:hypothetical protein [Methanococcoides seepicolus]
MYDLIEQNKSVIFGIWFYFLISQILFHFGVAFIPGMLIGFVFGVATMAIIERM